MPVNTAKSCNAPAPDRSGRRCDKPLGHDGGHWTYGGATLTWESAEQGTDKRSEGQHHADHRS